MSAVVAVTIPGHDALAAPELGVLGTRERLSQSALDGFFAIMDQWRVPMERAGELLGGVPRSTLYKLKSVSGTLRQDELTRISYVVGIYQSLHKQLPDELANEWVSRPNDDALFQGQTPLDYMLRAGILGMHQVRSLLDAAANGN